MTVKLLRQQREALIASKAWERPLPGGPDTPLESYGYIVCGTAGGLDWRRLAPELIGLYKYGGSTEAT